MSEDKENTTKEESEVFPTILNEIFEENFLEFESNEAPIIYISGYQAYKLKRKFKNCSNCISFCCENGEFNIDEDDMYEYFNEINRGGLSVPSP